MRKNIIHITGNDSYGVELEVSRWLGAFRGKFGDINIDRFDLGDSTSLKGIGDIILMSGLFAEKRLFIFRGGRDRKSKTNGIEGILEEKLGDLPDDHYLLFHNIGEKEEGLLDWLSKEADTRKIDTIWDAKVWGSRFDIEMNTLSLVLSTYRSAETTREKDDHNNLLGYDIAHTLEFISLMEVSGKKLEKIDIINLCHGYGGDTLFALVDAIAALNIELSLSILHRIAVTNKVDEWYTGLTSNLRNHLYIKYLKHNGWSESTIASILKVHPYVLKKSYTSRISYEAIRELYEKLIITSIAYKRGKGLKDSELGRILSIELGLLSLQKYKNL